MGFDHYPCSAHSWQVTSPGVSPQLGSHLPCTCPQCWCWWGRGGSHRRGPSSAGRREHGAPSGRGSTKAGIEQNTLQYDSWAFVKSHSPHTTWDIIFYMPLCHINGYWVRCHEQEHNGRTTILGNLSGTGIEPATSGLPTTPLCDSWSSKARYMQWPSEEISLICNCLSASFWDNFRPSWCLKPDRFSTSASAMRLCLSFSSAAFLS